MDLPALWLGPKDTQRTSTTPGPLKDIRVIDLTSMVFGPHATQIMAAAGVALGKA